MGDEAWMVIIDPIGSKMLTRLKWVVGYAEVIAGKGSMSMIGVCTVRIM